MLRNSRDWQAVAYMVALPTLVVWQWQFGWSWPLYAVVLFLTVGVSAIHHNHAHHPLWKWNWLNRLSDLWLTLLQGHPTYVLHVSHNGNHHRHPHGPDDIARTYRFGGDTNNLLGYLLHPLQAICVLYPYFTNWLRNMAIRRPQVFWYCMLQYGIVIVLWATLAVVDWRKWLLLVLVPQLHGLHWLLATNYLQHAHADGNSRYNFARNFDGLLNPLLFNIGYHTAHHLHGGTHWTELPRLHEQYKEKIHPQLLCGGLLDYMCRTYILSLFFKRFQSRSLMDSNSPPGTTSETSVC